MIACLVRNHAQQVQTIGMSGMNPEDLMIDFLGFGEPAAAMMPQGVVHHALNGLGL